MAQVRCVLMSGAPRGVAAASQERSYNSRQQKREVQQRSQRASVPPATHFVGLRCTTPPVESAVAAVHARLLARDAAFSHVLVSPATAHITLCVLSLQDDVAVRTATAALQTVHSRAPWPSLTGALDAFRGKGGVSVLYFDLAHDAEREALARLHADVEAAMRGAGLFIPRQAFTPHLTVAKARAATACSQPIVLTRRATDVESFQQLQRLACCSRGAAFGAARTRGARRRAAAADPSAAVLFCDGPVCHARPEGSGRLLPGVVQRAFPGGLSDGCF